MDLAETGDGGVLVAEEVGAAECVGFGGAGAIDLGAVSGFVVGVAFVGSGGEARGACGVWRDAGQVGG